MKTISVKESMVPEEMEKYGYVQKTIGWEIAHNAGQAAPKTMIVLGIVPMGIMTQVAGEPWAIGMAVALASSYAHFLKEFSLFYL